MAIVQRKESQIKLRGLLSSGDYVKKKESLINIHSRGISKFSLQSKTLGEGDGNENSTQAERNADGTDTESAYEESFCSDGSDQEFEAAKLSRHPSINEIPIHRFKNPKFSLNKQESVSRFESRIEVNNKETVSTSRDYTDSSFVLEDRMKCLSLNDVHPPSMTMQNRTRKNMSFTDAEVVKIERDNDILLRRIMAQQKPQKLKVPPVQRKLSSSAINRKRQQQKIDADNMLLLRRLQQAKSCALNSNKIPGYRRTNF